MTRDAMAGENLAMAGGQLPAGINPAGARCCSSAARGGLISLVAIGHVPHPAHNFHEDGGKVRVDPVVVVRWGLCTLGTTVCPDVFEAALG
jgi:hypothetical protein